MKSISLLFLVLVSQPLAAAGPTLACKANYQAEGPGGDTTRTDLKVTKQTADSLTMAAEHEGHAFQVVWNYKYTALYMDIKKGGERVANSTSRVPDRGHNESFLDVGQKPRMWVDCDFVELRP